MASILSTTRGVKRRSLEPADTSQLFYHEPEFKFRCVEVPYQPGHEIVYKKHWYAGNEKSYLRPRCEVCVVRLLAIFHTGKPATGDVKMRDDEVQQLHLRMQALEGELRQKTQEVHEKNEELEALKMQGQLETMKLDGKEHAEMTIDDSDFRSLVTSTDVDANMGGANLQLSMHDQGISRAVNPAIENIEMGDSMPTEQAKSHGYQQTGIEVDDFLMD